MINIIAETANEAWINTFKALLSQDKATGNKKYLRDEVVLIKITNPQVIKADTRFPMAQSDLDIINNQLITEVYIKAIDS